MSLCENPYIIDAMPCPCSTCDVCRIRRKRLWSSRIVLESKCHGDNAFVTYTYDREHLPSNGSLVPEHMQLHLKRLRKAIYPRKLRYFLAGEYGDESWRPHYHAALFGLSPVLDESIVRSTWDMGHVMVGTLTPESASYIAGYVTKKMTKKDDVRLAGRHPEFTRMSLKPGIGAPAMEFMARALESDHGLDWIAQNGDVPHQFLLGHQNKPLGRYLRTVLRGKLGFAEKGLPKEKLEAYKEEMRKLLSENVDFTEVETRAARKLKTQMFIVDRDKQKLRNVLSRARIFAPKKEI